MKTKLRGFWTLLLALAVQLSFAQEKTVKGVVSDASGPLPGVTVLVKGTNKGAQTDFDGKYTVKAKVGDVLHFNYMGMTDVFKKVGSSNVINVVMKEDAQALGEVVVTALGIKREERALPYAAQTVKSEDLNLTDNVDVKSAIVGKVAGVQLNSQAGSKLGSTGKLRIRGGISLTSDSDPLYIVDGVPTSDPNTVDMSNVESVDILKGPNATALYGQRADAGVVVIVTKKGVKGQKMQVSLNSSVVFDKAIVDTRYQNKYGQGYSQGAFGTFDYSAGAFGRFPYPEYMKAFDGKRYFKGTFYADESWGPRFDGKPYLPWYAYYPNSPYFAQEVPYVAHPNNIKDAYNVGILTKNGITISGGGDNFGARLSYTNIDQSGIIPFSTLKKHMISTNVTFDVSKSLQVGTSVNYSIQDVAGDFDDGYSNQTSGSFNQWFGRQVDTKKLRELKDLRTKEGYYTSWNNWGIDRIAYAEASGALGFKKPAFWFNTYNWLDKYKRTKKNIRLLADLHASYKFFDHFEAKVQVSRGQRNYRSEFYLPYDLAYTAAPELYNKWVNSFGKYYTDRKEDNYNAMLMYKNTYGDLDVSAFVGGNIRKNWYDKIEGWMGSQNSDSGGLILPDVYTYTNSKEDVKPKTKRTRKQVNSIYGNLSLGYKKMLYLDASIRKDWSSALPANKNGYSYPSVGGSFVFTELLDKNDILSFGKVRFGWAQVGNDVDANEINPTYPLGSDLYDGKIIMYDNSTLVDPNIKPAINTSQEIGLDLRFLNSRVKFSGTYYNEIREDEIISLSISGATGYDSFLTNAGKSRRKGIELSLGVDIFKTDDFNWSISANWAKNDSKIEDLPTDGIEAYKSANNAFSYVNVYHPKGGQWGELRGKVIKEDANGKFILNPEGSSSAGQYVVNDKVQYLGTVLPDFVGGVVNTLSYKGFTLSAAIDFQKGGKFFSLSEAWGDSSGLLERTAGINKLGNERRAPLLDSSGKEVEETFISASNAGVKSGGVYVNGVDSNGNAVEGYVDAHAYYQQFHPNRITNDFVHNADYIKLRDISLSYALPKKWLGGVFDSANISLIGRNLWLISVAKDNIHRWDPSEMSATFGENGQLPGTRSYGMNIKLTF